MDNSQKTNKATTCWVCSSENLVLAKPSNIEKDKRKQFTISNYEYGVTGNIHRCKECGFLQWSELEDSLPLYEDIQDASYESVRYGRSIQQKKILEVIKRLKPTGRLLDIGAGSGILVQEAIKLGYKAEGIEPSEYFYSIAKEHDLPVFLGAFPSPYIKGPYDIVTLIDVVEHIPQPLNLIRDIPKVIAKDGIVAVIVPDVGSLPAKILGWKWWNFKPGHIGYYNRKTLELLFNRAGFKLLKQEYRPSLYYPLNYVIERLNSYFPRFMKVPNCSLLNKVTFPLDLKDSTLAFYKLKD